MSCISFGYCYYIGFKGFIVVCIYTAQYQCSISSLLVFRSSLSGSTHAAVRRFSNAVMVKNSCPAFTQPDNCNLKL